MSYRIIALLALVLTFSPLVLAQSPAPLKPTATIQPDLVSEYEDLFERAIEALINNEPDRFKSLLTDSLIERTEKQYGAGSVDKIIKERFIPYFYDYDRLDPNVTDAKTSDVDGNEGMAYFRTFISESEKQKPFAIYIVNSKGHLLVANLVIGKTFRDLNP